MAVNITTTSFFMMAAEFSTGFRFVRDWLQSKGFKKLCTIFEGIYYNCAKLFNLFVLSGMPEGGGGG
jgi:hypothetical protein